MIRLAIVVLVLGIPGSAVAQAPPDSTAAGGDTTAVPAAIVPIDSVDVLFRAPDSTAAVTAPRRVPTRPSVAWTTIRSGLVPGWGQMVNHKPLKAAILFGIWGTFLYQAIDAEHDRKNAEEALGGGDDPALVAAVNDAVDRRNSRLWLMGATSLYAMIDAYVDVHFWNYKGEWSARIAPGPEGLPALALHHRF